jgi:hypothetical protein
MKYLLLFFFIYLIYYQFNISLLILPLLTLHFMSQPSFREKIFENPIWEKIKNQIQMFTENKVIPVQPIEVFPEKEKEKEKEKEIQYEEKIEYPEIIEIHDDAEATKIKKVRAESTELSVEELEELYSSLNQQLKEFNR